MVAVSSKRPPCSPIHRLHSIAPAVPSPQLHCHKHVVAEPAHPVQPGILGQIRPPVFNKGRKPTGKPEQQKGRKEDQKDGESQHRAAADGEEEEGDGEEEASVC